MSMKSLVL